MTIDLKRMTVEDLVTVQPWFDDPDARRFLGGPDWPARMLALAETVVGTTFRGAVQTGTDPALRRDYERCKTQAAQLVVGVTGKRRTACSKPSCVVTE